jgi:hypothetical protein
VNLLAGSADIIKSERSKGRLLGASAGLQFVVGLVFALSFFAFAAWARYDIPYRDDWDWLQLLLSGPPTFAKLFTPHNEHLIPLPRLLFSLQYAVGGAGGRLLFAVALLSLSTEAFAFWREIRKRWPGEASLFVFGAAAVLLFSTFQLQSFVFVATAAFPLVQAAAVMAIVTALDASEQGSSQRPILFAAIASTAAVFSLTNGLVVPLVVAGVLWVRRAPTSIVFLFGAMTIVSIGAHLVLVPRVLPTHPIGVSNPAPLVPFFLAFFGVALAAVSVPLASAVGAVMIAGGLFAGSRVIVDRERTFRVEIFAIAVMAFTALSIAMIAFGRLQFGGGQAAQSRYSTCTLAYAAALAVWAFSYADRKGPSWRSPIIMRIVLAVSLVALPIDLFIGTVWRVKADNVSAAALAVRSRTHDDEWVTALHPIPETVYGLAERLRPRNDAAIVDPLIGKSLGESGTLTVCQARPQIVPLPNGALRLTGVAEAGAAQGVVLDRTGIVRGLVRRAPIVATPAPSERDVIIQTWQWLTSRNSHSRQWLGFADGGGERPYRFVAVSDGRRPVCEAALEAF